MVHRDLLVTEPVLTQVTLSDGTYALRVDGVLRTMAAAFPLWERSADDMTPISSSTFKVCWVEERVGGSIDLAMGNAACKNFNDWTKNGRNKALNPPIDFPSADLSTTYIMGEEDAGAVLQPISAAPNASLLRGNLTCTPQYASLAFGFLRTADGEYLRHDPRLALLDNTVAAPAGIGEAGATSISPATLLPAAKKNFLNRETCRVEMTGGDVTFSSVTFELSEEMVRAFYEQATRLVYYLDGLRLEEPFDVSLCDGISRWRKYAGACSPEDVPNDSTRDSILSALTGSEDANPNVVDIEVTGACSDAIGARVTVGNSCWHHVHPDELNVYDASYWPSRHPGGSAFIFQFAQAGGVALEWPLSHIMDRWKSNRKWFQLLGRFGDAVDFHLLPSDMQRADIAAIVGATPIAGDSGVYEACGSPGEVANDPAAGNLYLIHTLGDLDSRNHYDTHLIVNDFSHRCDISTLSCSLTDPDLSYNAGAYVDQHNERQARPFDYMGKNIIWTMQAQYAQDQLRQRMAWALYQIFVVSDDAMIAEAAEAWCAYTDIFVRHAFGSFRSVLREVSWSPMMAQYLTYLDNRAQAYSGSYPDENYAREVMQLFTTGLWSLNDDGTRAHDETGAPIPTHTNDDILTLARAWTGFIRSSSRGNLENLEDADSGGINYIDPMAIQPFKRDPFPKLDMLGGYVGDGYPLCVDSAPQAFLKAGATFDFKGTVMSGELTRSYEEVRIDLTDPASPLHRSLCGLAMGAVGAPGDLVAIAMGEPCTLRSTVTLDATLPCHGFECESEPRLFKVTHGNVTAYYEWRRPACTELAFFPNPMLVAEAGRDRDFCADPRTPVAGNCCLTWEEGANRATVFGQCNYPGERMTFDAAVARCASGGGTMCPGICSWEHRSCSLPQTGGGDWPERCDWKNKQVRQWRNASCAMRVRVDRQGWVMIVHDVLRAVQLRRTSGGRPTFSLELGSTTFRVAWDGGSFPSPLGGDCSGLVPAGTCAMHDETCLCDVDVEEAAVFGTAPAGAPDVEAGCRIGSLCPDPAEGVYAL